MLLFVVFLIPFHRAFMPPFLALFFVTSVWGTSLDFVKSQLNKNKVIIFVLTAYFLMHLVGLIYTSNFSHALFDLEVKLSLLLFPLFFFGIYRRKFIELSQLQSVFIVSVSIALFYCLMSSSASMMAGGDYSEFFYNKFSVIHHPSYFSIIINGAMAIAIERLMKTKRFIFQILYFLVILFLVFGVFLTASRMGVLIMLFLLFLMTVKYVFLSFTYQGMGKSLVLYLAVYVAFLSQTGLLEKRFETGVDSMYKSLQDDEEGLDENNQDEILKGDAQRLSKSDEGDGVRVLIWNESFNIFLENPIFGVGTGDIKDELLINYEEKGFSKAKNRRYNVHNQLLQAAATLGILGFFSLLISLIYPLYFAVKFKLFAETFIMLSFAMGFLTESMLEIQIGVVYFAVFTSLVWWKITDTITKKNNL